MSAPPPRRSDGPRVIVIGAGAIGLCCAYELARRGVDVTIIDADAAFPSNRGPRSASFAAAGMLGPYSEALHEGPGVHRRLGDLCHDGIEAWREIAGEDATLARCIRFSGSMLLAFDEADAARVHRAFRRAQAHGADAEFVEGLSQRADPDRFGGDVYATVWLPNEGIVAPGQLMSVLAARVAMFGGSVLRGRAVSEIDVHAGRATGVRLESGALLEADLVVAAPGALGLAALSSVLPILRHIIPTKGILGAVRSSTSASSPDVVRAPFGYFLQTGEEYRFGASMQPHRADLDEDEEVLAALFGAFRRMLPGLAFEEPPRFAGIGVRPMTPDGAPLVGASGPKGCLVATGHGRNGWLLAPLTGRAIADLVVGEAPAPIWSSMPVERFG